MSFFGSIELGSRSRVRRRPSRLAAMVEALDPRLLMATNVAGTPLAVSGTPGNPLQVEKFTPRPVGGLGGSPSTVYAPIGTPIPLVSLDNAGQTLDVSGYSGTVNWGDGSATDSAIFGTYGLLTANDQNGLVQYVHGPEHTYAAVGSYPITVTVTAPGDTTSTVFTTMATITPVPLTISGGLNPASDTGFFNNDSVTAITTPNYLGTTLPGASVTLSATSDQTGQTLVVGTGVADASGNWNITTVPFVDGSYSLIATATTATATTQISLTGYIFNIQHLVIDTAGPKITNFQVTNARTGAFNVTFADTAGLFVATVTNPNHYAFNRPTPTPRRGQTFSITNVGALGIIPPTVFSNDPVVVAGTVQGNRRLIAQNGSYVYTIFASGILSRSGVALDGSYNGGFPTGNGLPGSDFHVQVRVRNGRASAPIALVPTVLPMPTIRSRAVRHHA